MESIAIFIKELSELSEEVRKKPSLTELENKAIASIKKIIAYLLTLQKDEESIKKLNEDNKQLNSKIIGFSVLNNHLKKQIEKLKQFIEKFLNPTYDPNGIFQAPDISSIPGLSKEFIPIFQRLIQRIKELEEQKLKLVKIIEILEKKIPGLNINEPLLDLESKINSLGDPTEVARLKAEIARLNIVLRLCESSGKIAPYNPEAYNAYLEEVLRKMNDDNITQNINAIYPFRYQFLIDDKTLDSLLPKKTLGGVKTEVVEPILNIPTEWKSGHNLRYRNNNILKLLSISPANLKTFKPFENDTLKKILVFSIFWDIQDLINVWETKLNATLKERYSNYYKKLLFDDESYENTDFRNSEKLKKNNKLIKGVVDFASDPNKVENSQFILIDDLIDFYRNIANQYISGINQFEKDDAIIFGFIRSEFNFWNLLGPQYDKMKQYLEIDEINLALNAKYLEENNEPVKTYLRVRSDTKISYNEYFNLYIEPRANVNDIKSIYVTGPDPNINIPLHVTDAISPTNNKGLIPYKLEDGKGSEKVGTIKQFSSYKYGYLYGPFTKIFTPNQNNSQISDLMVDDMKKTLGNGNSIFVIGYGASGSGKTSSLIFRKWEEGSTVMKEEGIILEILKSLENVDSLKVSIHEIFSKELLQNDNVKIDEIKYNDFVFTKAAGLGTSSYILTDSQPQQSGNYLQKNKFINDKDEAEWKEKKVEWKLENGIFTHSRLRTSPETFDQQFTETSNLIRVTELGEFIITLVDNVRMVSPTPNNVQSSRSHVLVFISFIYNSNPVNIIIGDLAGVENKFMCDDPKTRKEFLKLVRPLEKKPFYTNKEYIDVENKGYPEIVEKIFNNFNYTKIESISNIDKFKEILEIKKKELDDFSEYYNDYINKTPDEFTSKNLSKIQKIIDDSISMNVTILSDLIKREIESNPSMAEFYNKLLEDINKLNYINTEFQRSNYINDPANKEYFKYTITMDGMFKRIETDEGMQFKKDRRKYIYQRYSDIFYYIIGVNESNIDFYNNNTEREPTDKSFNDKVPAKIIPFLFKPKFILKPASNIPIMIKRYNELSQRNNIFNLELIKTFYSQYIVFIKSIETRASSIANLDIKNSLLSLVRNMIDKENIYTKYRLNILIKYSILYKLQELSFIKDIENKIETAISDINNSDTKATIKAILDIYPEIYSTIKDNIDLYYNKIRERCNERMVEGMFINKSLYGMRKDLISIIKNNQRNAIFQRLPLFKSPCLKYYCDSATSNCYYNKDFNDGQIKKIMEVISNKIRSSKLSIVVFGMINITQGVNDPPKMPYIDLTEIKTIRDILFTKIDLHQEKTFNYDTDIKQKVINLHDSKFNIIIDEFKGSLGSSIINNYTLLYNAFINSTDKLGEKAKKLVNLIDCLEEINSTSVIGTMDFLHTMKNSLQTDINCNIINTSGVSSNIKEVEPYTNIITGSTLRNDIQKQIDGVEMYARYGGSKDKLIKKHKKLYNLYKSLKN